MLKVVLHSELLKFWNIKREWMTFIVQGGSIERGQIGTAYSADYTEENDLLQSQNK